MVVTLDCTKIYYGVHAVCSARLYRRRRRLGPRRHGLVGGVAGPGTGGTRTPCGPRDVVARALGLKNNNIFRGGGTR